MKELIWGRYALWAYTGLAAAIFAGLSGLSTVLFEWNCVIHSDFWLGLL